MLTNDGLLFNGETAKTNYNIPSGVGFERNTGEEGRGKGRVTSE